jgi:predicted DNA-binding protein with PD1-like motif
VGDRPDDFLRRLIERRISGRICAAQERKHLRRLESVETSRRKRGRARSIGRPPCNRNCFTKPVDSARLQSFSQPDEVLSSLQQFVQRENIHAATFTAIGALSAAVLLYVNWEKKEYENIPVREQVEVAALIGDVADDPKGKPTLHIHIVLGTRDGSAKAGHLGEGHVRPTLEVIVTESPAHLRKVKDDETGLALIRPAA